MNKNLANTTHVSVGQTFGSYASLCKTIGIEAHKGKSRQCDEKELRRYFDWERVPGTYQLVIISTYYDNPKPAEDHRTGIHTTEFGTPLQSLILANSWGEAYYTRSQILKRLRLISDNLNAAQTRTNPKTDVYYKYISKIYSVLLSAITQLSKQDDAICSPLCLADIQEGRQLNDSEIDTYKQIKESLLYEFGVKNEQLLFDREEKLSFFARLDAETYKQMGISGIRQAIRIQEYCPDKEIDKPTYFKDHNTFLDGIGKKLVDNYEKNYHKGFGRQNGLIPVVEFQANMQQLITSLYLPENASSLQKKGHAINN